MRDLHIETAARRNSLHWKPGTVTWEDLIGWLSSPAGVKECGNYVLGTLRDTTVTHSGAERPCSGRHRSNAAIVSRSAITLDMDHPAPGVLDDLELMAGWAAIVHTTYSSTPEEPRYRVIIPLSRDVTGDEYYHLVTRLVTALGADSFDLGSREPARYMFKPSTMDEDRCWWSKVLPGDPLDPDPLLDDMELDLSGTPAPVPGRTKRDPFKLGGVVGAFNRVYDDWDRLFEVFDLPYEPAGAERWHLVGAAAAAGVGTVRAGLLYSHHANDPAHGQAVSAFDLVRLHRFGHLDEGAAAGTPVNRLPSTAAMVELATRDAAVVTESIDGDFDEAAPGAFDGPADEAAPAPVPERVLEHWETGLARTKTGAVKDDIRNWDRIVSNDPAFRGLVYNELSMAVETTTDLPWRESAGRSTFDSGDRASLRLYLERRYLIRPSSTYIDDLVTDVAHRTRINPVRDWLRGLEWDRTPRLETCLPGVPDSAHARLVARKSLVAAVARMMEPGVKWDHVLVLYGPEGLGKSWWIDRMSRGFSAELGRVGDKDTLITMQRSWLMTADEGHAMKSSDFDAQKAFITRSHDVFRMPYERESSVHPRHCVIWATTNNEVFLRRQEGNRRFLIVEAVDKVDFSLLTEEYIEQVWAEALHLYRAGEPLFLTEMEARLAAEERETYTEEDVLLGQVQEYVSTLVPKGWDSMTPQARQLWFYNRGDDIQARGTEEIDEVCSLQIWVEALGRRVGEHRRADLLEINRVLKDLPGWSPLPGRRRVPGYGPQQVYARDLI